MPNGLARRVVRGMAVRGTGGPGGSSGPSYNAETLAFIARRSVPPTDADKSLIDAIFTAIKLEPTKFAGGFWLACDNDADSLLNWMGSSNPLTKQGTLTFAAYKGYKGNGTTGYLDTGLDLGTIGAGYAQNDSHVGVVLTTDPLVGDNAQQVFGLAGSTTNQTFLIPNTTSGTTGTSSTFRVNQASSSSISSISGRTGYYVCRRTGSTSTAVYKNASLINTGSIASTAPPTGFNFCFLRSNTNYSTARWAGGHVGNSVLAATITALNTAIQAYLNANGAYAA